MSGRPTSARWRRNRGFVVAFAAGVAVVAALLGSSRVTATSGEPGGVALASEEVHGVAALFDGGIVHELAIEYDVDDYTRMIDTFQASGRKEFIEAKVTIDGTPIERVGLRLKGNSTLFGLGGRGPGGRRFPGGGEDFGGAGFPGGPRFASPASADEPQLLPWLISFDEFVDGQRYEGYESIAVRPGGRRGTTQTALNEALSLRLTALAGEPAAQSMYASFAINGGAPVLRLVLEEPDDRFGEDNFDHAGVLYKSLSSGRFDDLGDDPVAYRDAFRQITRGPRPDLRPVIDLIRWTSDASDAAFAAGLDDRVEVPSLARYVALHNLLLDWDDMSGPGQNYYLWHDLETDRFTVVSWDLNLSLERDPAQGPFDEGGFGGSGGGFGGRGGHPLKERFLAVPAFRQLYRGTYAELYDELFASGRALDELHDLKELIASGDVIEESVLSQEVADLRRLLEERTAALGAIL